MNSRRLLLPVLLVALLVIGTEPALAQTSDSVTEQIIWELNNNLIAVAFPITLIVEGILFYTIWKYRNNDDPSPTVENRRLEITWTIATALVLLFVGFAAYGAMANPNVITTEEKAQQAMDDGNPVVVEAQANQWGWTFNYTNENISVDDPMKVPTDRTVILKVTTDDVLHAFHAPDLGLKADAVPGKTNWLMTTVKEEGTYRLYCAEFCGSGHSAMMRNISAVSGSEYQSWVTEQQNSSAS